MFKGVIIEVMDTQGNSEGVYVNTTNVNNQPKVNSSVSTIEPKQQNNNLSQEHPLDKYKSLIERYDVQLVKDVNYPDGHYVVTERSTGKVPEGIPPEQRTQLTNDLAFAKSWISSCSSGLSISGKVNEFGYDEKVWEYAFNDGARDTFDNIVDILKNNTNPNLTTEMIIDSVSNKSAYKYSEEITKTLLRPRDDQYILDNVHKTLLAEAGFGQGTSQVSDQGGMEMV